MVILKIDKPYIILSICKMASVSIVGKVLTDPIEVQFTRDLQTHGHRVNLYTFDNDTTVPSTYGNINAIRRITNVPIAWREMGHYYVIYPITK